MRSQIPLTPQDTVTIQAFVNALVRSSVALESLQPQLYSIGEKIAQQQSCLVQCIRSLISKNPQFAKSYRQERMQLRPYEKALAGKTELSDRELDWLQKQLLDLGEILRSPDLPVQIITYKNRANRFVEAQEDLAPHAGLDG